MAHLAMASTKGSTTFSPLSKSFDRVTKYGDVPIFNFLIGSQYNTKSTGELSTTTVGNLTSGTVSNTGGKLTIAGGSSSGTAENIATFTTFTFLYPSTTFIGHSELQNATITGNDLQRIRYVFEDLSTTDKIIVDLEAGLSNAQLVLRQEVDGVETDLVTQQLTTGVIEVIWELDYNEDGTTKFWYKESATDRTRIYNGAVNADIGEAKVSCKLMTNVATVKTVKSDYLLIFYKSLNIGYSIPDITDKPKGRVKMFDTNGQASESLWTEVFASDHTFAGERVIDNGLIRVWLKSTPKMEIYGWNTTALSWDLIGSNIPKATGGSLATTLHDVVFSTFTDSQCKFQVKWGIVNHTVDIKRGMPYVRIVQNSKEARILTSKRRFALSTAVNTDIPDFNQENTDDANRGNPLNLSPTKNPFVFTDDTNTTTGLQLMDDNWLAWYNENSSNDMVGFLGNLKRPTGLSVSAVSATQLEFIDITWDIYGIYCIGILESDPTSTIGGIPLPFNIGNPDEDVKWRATEGLLGFNQRPFLRKKR